VDALKAAVKMTARDRGEPLFGAGDLARSTDRWRRETLARLHDERRRLMAKLAAIDDEIKQLEAKP